MSQLFRPRAASALALVMLIAACSSAPARPAQRAPARAPVVTAAPAPSGLYGAEEALRDALSAPLQYIGTGKWPGVQRMYACAYRNARVVVVDAYCSRSERQAFRVDVYSPARGRVRIYAESRGTVSAHVRPDYFTFMVESEPARAALDLSVSFAALEAYEQRRYAAFLPACFAGQELNQPRSGCLGALSGRDQGWLAGQRAFVANANDDWYRTVRELRALAARYGREPD